MPTNDERADFDRLSAGILAGRGVVARYPGVVCVADATDTEPVRALVALCAAVAGFEPGRPLARRLAAWLSGPDAPPSSLRFGTLADAGDRWAVFLQGAVRLHDADTGTTILGADAAAWTDRLVTPGGPLTLLLDPVEEEPAASTEDPFADLHDLRAGAVPGRGVVLATTSAARHAAVPPLPAAPAPSPVTTPDASPGAAAPATPPAVEPGEPAVVNAGPGRAVPDESPDEPMVSDEPGPPPIAEAPLAEEADLRPPHRARRIDIESAPTPGDSPPDVDAETAAPTEPSIPRPPDDSPAVEERTGELVSDPRSPLGLLIFDDGVTYTVDAEYLVGRMPDIDERVRNGSLRSIVIEDRSGAVSRVHAEVRVDGRNVLLVDSRSRNGTHVAGPGAEEWTPVPTGGSHRLTPGTRVRLGSRTFVFESPSDDGASSREAVERRL